MSEFLTGGGEMGELIRNFDWSATPLGSPENWDQSLKTSVRICLDSRFPIVLWLGKDLRLIYNNAWRTALGSTKHPSALGSPAKIVWAEIWDTIGPMLESVMQTGEATWIDDGLLLLERFGYIEESYWTYSYSAIRLNSGEVGGVFAAVHETTATVIGERQLTSLKNFTNLAADEKTVDAIFRNAAAAFEKNNKDFPFAIIYKIEGITAKPIARSGIDEGLVSLKEVDITEPLEETFNLCKAYETNQIIVSQNNGSKTNLPTGAWEVEPTHFIHIPITTAGQKHPHAILLAALNPYRKYDDSYRQFTTLVADQIALEVNSVLAYEEERKRAEALAEIDRTKTAFFTNISHEFRTPLTLILGSLEELLNNGKSEVNEDRETIETTHRNALRLLRLVNNLLDFNRIEAGKAKATFIDVTEEVLARKKIEESEQRFSSLVKDATVGIIVLQGEDLKVAVVNAAYGKLIGRTPEQL
ncbi:MAG TPA: histidine kinase dimerization/phospho-acceptor domain-containing protein, partial [Chitinophagaceae bacterium]|nr:histidine kinase dimerization/phospho-acceptor domain-containing protein [Chitinophagaceae bacterium]